MRLIEEVSLQTPLDRWLSLPALSKVVGLSVCTLRAVCTAKTAPLPYYRMNEPRVVMTRKGKRSTATGKILVRWSDQVYAFNLSCPHQNTALRWNSIASAEPIGLIPPSQTGNRLPETGNRVRMHANFSAKYA